MEPRPPRVRAVARVGLAILAAIVIPAISWAQDVVSTTSTTSGATPGDVMTAASAAIPVLREDSSMTALQLAEAEKAIRDVKSQYDALEAQIRAMEAKLDQFKAEVAKLQALLATLEQNKAKLLAHLKDAQSSLSLMRVVAADRAAASKLLDAMKQRNATSLGMLLDPASSPASIVSVDALSVSAIKMIFKVGVLTQCVATRPNCGTATYSIVK